MRAYAIASGAIFALLALAHLYRLLAEGTGPLSNPIFVVTTIVAISFAAWAFLVLRRMTRL